MPLYEYECVACGHRFELLQKFSDEPAKLCVRCGGPVNRLISRPAIQFKGTGWSVTNYPRKGSAACEGKDDGKGTKESEKAASESDKTGKDLSNTSTTPKADKLPS